MSRVRTPGRRRGARVAALGLLLTGAGCTYAFFSPHPYPDRTRPVARIETRGGVEFGATTTEGILFLGRTATEGPCRVHYFLGPQGTPLVESGQVRPAGGVYYTADIDLKTPAVPPLERDLRPDDRLVAILHQGAGIRELPVERAAVPGVDGDVLAWPGERLPAGTGIFTTADDDSWRFVGLVAGEAVVQGDGGEQRFVVFTGPDRLREALATPQPHPAVRTVHHRPDDITVYRDGR